MNTIKTVIGRSLLCGGVACMLLLAGGAYAQPAPPPAGAKYVNMGSSFAAGPSIAPPADNPTTRCGRSAQNYAHQLARRHNLSLVDVSCGGSTTAHLLGPWNELAPQLDAVDATTRLVTMTTGGNDLGYLGSLGGNSCVNVAAKTGTAPQPPCRPPPPLPNDETYAGVETRLRQIIVEVHRRAPQARLVIVDYLTILPPTGSCAVMPLSPVQADASRGIARRLNEITVRVAKETGTELIPASKISEGHDVCAKDAWLNGYPSPGVPVEPTFYHPRLAGMTAIADALEKRIWPTHSP
jgi:lysophospholipase L1-like esterase